MTIVNNLILKKAENFFFAEEDVSGICIFRILIGLICILNSLNYIVSFDFFYSVNAVLSRELFEQKYADGFLNLFGYSWQLNISPSILGYLSLLFSIFLFMGFRTRSSALGCFIFVQAFCLRNPHTAFGFDDILRNFLFILFFSASGAMYSVDSLIAKIKGKPLRTSAAIWPLRLLQIQISALYAMAAISKMTNPTWRDGTALYYISRMAEMRRLTVPWIFDQIWMVKVMTWSVLIIELALAFGLWIRKSRNILIVAGIGLHLSIDLVMTLPLFQYLMIAGLLCFCDFKSLFHRST
jgi:hypothetical protein